MFNFRLKFRLDMLLFSRRRSTATKPNRRKIINKASCVSPGRRLASLQAGMGVRLLQRTAEGYVLTLAGESIRSRVERVEAEALSVEHAVAGHDVRLEGVVRVSSSQLVTSHLLAPCFAALHAHHPGILIEAYPSLIGEPLATHDADISVRLRRFEHHDVVARTIGTIA